MKKSYAVIGLGRFGYSVARELANNNVDILAIDKNEENVAAVADFINNCAICDSTKKKDLEDLGFKSIDHAIIAIGNSLEASILTTINLKSLGVKEITVRVDDSDYKEIFKTLGATSVIIPEEASAISLANRIISDTFLDFYKINSDYSIVQIKVSQDFTEASIISLGVRQKYLISIIGIIRDAVFKIPEGQDNIKGGDILLVIGKKQDIRKFDNFVNGE